VAPSPLNLSLPSDLQRRLAAAADSRGATVSALCQQWILEGLERLEESQVTDRDGVGRCSVRTGMRTTGPKPLPLQQ
jgi:hypothetical protein